MFSLLRSFHGLIFQVTILIIPILQFLLKTVNIFLIFTVIVSVMTMSVLMIMSAMQQLMRIENHLVNEENQRETQNGAQVRPREVLSARFDLLRHGVVVGFVRIRQNV